MVGIVFSFFSVVVSLILLACGVELQKIAVFLLSTLSGYLILSRRKQKDGRRMRREDRREL